MAVIIETVKVVRDYLDAELVKYETREQGGEFTTLLFDSPETFTQTKNVGVGLKIKEREP